MPEGFKNVTIKPVQPAHGAKPQESFFSFVNTVYLVIGEALVEIEVGKMVSRWLLRRKQQYQTHASRKQNQGFDQHFQIRQHTNDKYTKRSVALKEFIKLYFLTAVLQKICSILTNIEDT